MPSNFSRREFITGLGAMAAATSQSTSAAVQALSKQDFSLGKSPFKVGVINDEISEDFDRACAVASKQFGMRWMELRGMWNKNVVNLDAGEIAEAQRILKKNNLEVTDIASPLFKVDWPGAPKSKFSPRHDQFNANFTYDQQGEVLDRAIELAKKFSTDRIRCFDFWRLEEQGPYRKAMNDQLQQTAEKLRKIGLILVLENEAECNTGKGAEAARTLNAVPSSAFMLNWDPGNAAMAGETPYPDGYNLLPKNRIGHCHCKDATRTEKGIEWAAMGSGFIDWVGQFKALKRDGYRHAVSLETHWRGPGTAESSTVQSWAGMKTELEKAGAV
jgi:sugar phosphate isomerase/epimerase